MLPKEIEDFIKNNNITDVDVILLKANSVDNKVYTVADIYNYLNKLGFKACSIKKSKHKICFRGKMYSIRELSDLVGQTYNTMFVNYKRLGEEAFIESIEKKLEIAKNLISL